MVYPRADPTSLIAQQAISFRMSNHWNDAPCHHLLEDTFNRGRDYDVRELDQQVGAVIDCVLERVAKRILNVRRAQMKVASSMDLQHVTSRPLELRDPCGNLLWREQISMVRMWRGDDFGCSCGVRELNHGDRGLERLRAVIEPGEDVTMNIDHLSNTTSRYAATRRFFRTASVAGYCSVRESNRNQDRPRQILPWRDRSQCNAYKRGFLNDISWLTKCSRSYSTTGTKRHQRALVNDPEVPDCRDSSARGSSVFKVVATRRLYLRRTPSDRIDEKHYLTFR